MYLGQPALTAVFAVRFVTSEAPKGLWQVWSRSFHRMGIPAPVWPAAEAAARRSAATQTEAAAVQLLPR